MFVYSIRLLFSRWVSGSSGHPERTKCRCPQPAPLPRHSPTPCFQKAHRVPGVWGEEHHFWATAVHRVRSGEIQAADVALPVESPCWLGCRRLAAFCACARSQSRCAGRQPPCMGGSELSARGLLEASRGHVLRPRRDRLGTILNRCSRSGLGFVRTGGRLQARSLLEDCLTLNL